MQEEATSLLQLLKYLKNNPLKRKHDKQKKQGESILNIKDKRR